MNAGTQRRADGFSLVELLVAVTLGLLVIGAAVALYLRACDAQAVAESTARLQENARYALAVIEADVRMAGYWGLHDRADWLAVNAASAFPAACGAGWTTDAAHYVAGDNGAYALPCPASGGGARAGSDVLVVRRASAQRIAPQSGTVGVANRDRVLLVSSRAGGELFVPHDLGNHIPPGYATSDPAGEPPLADTRAMQVDAYYVSRNSSVARGYPALRRKTLNTGPAIGEEEVLPGVEDLQFQIGVDVDDDGDADAYVDPSAAPAGRPVSIVLWLRLRALETEAGYRDSHDYAYADVTLPSPGDAHRRLLVTRTIYLRNSQR